MRAPAEHQKHLSKRNYPLRCSTEVFEDTEIKLLTRYGFWIEALVNGSILPITDEERRLIDVHMGKAEPLTFHECAWRKLIERRAWEQNEKESPHYKLVDQSEQWFSRADWKQMRTWKNS